jgi:hypothetical protein
MTGTYEVPKRLKTHVGVSSAALDAWFDLEAALQADVIGILHLADGERTSQPLRRAFVRSVWGYVEGSVHGLAHYVDKIETLTNSRHPKRPPEKDRTLDKVMDTLKWCTFDRLTPGWSPDFGNAGWTAVRASYAVRNRLMHPKDGTQFQVTADDYNCTRDAVLWFTKVMVEVKGRHQAWCKTQLFPSN